MPAESFGITFPASEEVFSRVIAYAGAMPCLGRTQTGGGLIYGT